MERLGIPIVVLLQRNVEEILANIRLLARLCGVTERGEELVARLQARLDKVEQRVAGLKPPSVVMITGRLGNGLLLVTRPGTYTGDAIVRAGFVECALVSWTSDLPPDLPPNGGKPWVTQAQRSARDCHI